MHPPSTFVTDIAMVAGVAAITGMIARAVGLPTILGYLFAGLVVGPSLPIPLFADAHRVEALAEFGVIFVMFAVGLEFRVKRLLEVLPRSGFTALVQIAFLGWSGFTLGSLLGWGPLGSGFLGACLAISSTMVVTGIFAQQEVEADVREHVLGVLVVQDVVAIALIATMTALAAGQSVAPGELAVLVARLSGVLAGMLGLGVLIVPRLVRRVVKHGGTEGTAVLAVGLAFSFALIAQAAGYSVALGAFVAGITVAESGLGQEVEHAIEPLRAVFAALFFVSIGMAVDPVVAWHAAPTALAVGALVVGAQLASVTLGSLLSGSPLRRAVLSGLALGQIGELSFILAGIGAAAGVVPESLVPTLVVVATATCFTTPVLLRRGPALVARLDRLLPPRAQHLLAVQQAWLERLRGGEVNRASMRPAMRSLVVDFVALLILAVTALALREPLAHAVQGAIPMPEWSALAAVEAVALLLALPLLVGLLRNARALAQLAARAIEDDRSDGPRPTTLRMLEALGVLALVIAVGFPALAILRPLVPGPWAEPVLLACLLAAAFLVYRSADAVDGQFVSGAEALARQLGRHAGEGEGEDDPTDVDHPIPLVPGLDRAIVIALPDGARAIGLTLAQLDVRVRSGATVVAIHKPGAEVVLPTGHERLEPGDVLALAGADEAIERARALLTETQDR